MTTDTNPNHRKLGKLPYIGEDNDPGVSERLTANSGGLSGDGMMDFLDRTGDVLSLKLQETFSSENVGNMLDRIDEVFPGLKDGLTELFNKLTGAAHGRDATDEFTHSANDAITTAVYGTSDPENEGERMASTFLQRDNDTFAAQVSIGAGVGAITELNGIEYRNGRPVNADGEDEDAAEFREAMERGDREAEFQETLSQKTLDAMEWQGDQNTVWDFGGTSGSRQSWYSAAKAARKNLNKVAEENNWSEDERARQERLISNYQEALKSDDQEKAQQAWQDMRPETQHEVIVQQRKSLEVSAGVNRETAALVTSTTSNAGVSTSAGADILAQSSVGEAPKQPVGTRAAVDTKEAALKHPPDIALKDNFTAAASLAPVQPQPEIKLASAELAAKASAPALNQTFSF